MWYEILPSFFIITGALAAPLYCNNYIHKWVFGNVYLRDKTERWDRYLYQRDIRLTGNAYKCNGLDAIPDDE